MSQFIVDKTVVVSAAMAAISDVKSRRRKALNKILDARMNRWFFPCKTRESARKEAESMRSSLCELSIAEFLGWQTMDVAKQLIDACSIVKTDTVVLGREDAAFIKEWK